MSVSLDCFFCFFFFQAEDGIRDGHVTGVQTCALPIYRDVVLLEQPLDGAGEGRDGLLHAVDVELDGLVGGGDGDAAAGQQGGCAERGDDDTSAAAPGRRLGGGVGGLVEQGVVGGHELPGGCGARHRRGTRAQRAARHGGGGGLSRRDGPPGATGTLWSALDGNRIVTRRAT